MRKLVILAAALVAGLAFLAITLPAAAQTDSTPVTQAKKKATKKKGTPYQQMKTARQPQDSQQPRSPEASQPGSGPKKEDSGLIADQSEKNRTASADRGKEGLAAAPVQKNEGPILSAERHTSATADRPAPSGAERRTRRVAPENVEQKPETEATRTTAPGLQSTTVGGSIEVRGGYWRGPHTNRAKALEDRRSAREPAVSGSASPDAPSASR